MNDLFSDLSATYLVVHFCRGERSVLENFSRLKSLEPEEAGREVSASMGSSLKLIREGVVLVLPRLSEGED